MKTVKYQKFGEVEFWEFGYNPFGKPLMTSIFYLIDRVVIDTAFTRVRTEVLDVLESKHPEKVLLTHCHEDHSGNALAIKNRFQIDVYGHPLTIKKMAAKQIIFPYQRILWGKAQRMDALEIPSIIETNRYRLRPIHVPGHSKDMTVYLEEKNGWLFSGDLFIGTNMKMFRADEHIANQISSLKKILTWDFDTLFCSHNPQLEKGKLKISEKLGYLENLVGEVQLQVKKGVPEKEIIRAMDRKHDRVIKWFTMGNMSFANMIRSAVRDYETS